MGLGLGLGVEILGALSFAVLRRVGLAFPIPKIIWADLPLEMTADDLFGLPRISHHPVAPEARKTVAQGGNPGKMALDAESPVRGEREYSHAR